MKRSTKGQGLLIVDKEGVIADYKEMEKLQAENKRLKQSFPSYADVEAQLRLDYDYSDDELNEEYKIIISAVYNSIKALKEKGD